jgi:thiopurine S-methyltransferase
VEHEFWLQRWVEGRTGFHKEIVNPALHSHFQRLSHNKEDQIFVPLCGKSLDLFWLSQHCKKVLGVELSSIAAEAFFEESKLTPSVKKKGSFNSYEDKNIEILQGDFFELQPKDLKAFNRVYDRASLIALPSDMRRKYAEHMLKILPTDSRYLLVSFDYNQEEMPGPPFAVSEKEIHELFGKRFEIEVLERKDFFDENDPLKEEISKIERSVFILT